MGNSVELLVDAHALVGEGPFGMNRRNYSIGSTLWEVGFMHLIR